MIKHVPHSNQNSRYQTLFLQKTNNGIEAACWLLHMLATYIYTYYHPEQIESGTKSCLLHSVSESGDTSITFSIYANVDTLMYNI